MTLNPLRVAWGSGSTCSWCRSSWSRPCRSSPCPASRRAGPRRARSAAPTSGSAAFKCAQPGSNDCRRAPARHRREPRELHRRAAPLRVAPPRFGFVIKKEAARACRSASCCTGSATTSWSAQIASRAAATHGESSASLEDGEAVAFFPRHVPPGRRASRDSTAARLRCSAHGAAGRAGRDPRHASRARRRQPWPRLGRIEVEVLEPLPAEAGAGATSPRAFATRRARGSGRPSTRPTL